MASVISAVHGSHDENSSGHGHRDAGIHADHYEDTESMKNRPGSYTMWLLEKKQLLLATVNGCILTYVHPYNQVFTGQARQLTLCSKCESVLHDTTNCPEQPQLQSAQNALSQPTRKTRPKESNICLLFNRK